MFQIISLAKISIKKILSFLIIKILLLSFLVIILYIALYEDFPFPLSFFLALFPYMFLFSTADMIKDEIERGYLDNRILIVSSKIKILMSKIIGIFFINTFFFFIIYSCVSFIGLFKHCKLFIDEKIVISLLVGIYYIFVGLLLGFIFKGASNAIFWIFLQIFMLFLSTRVNYLISLEKGEFLTLSEKIKGIAFLILFPNFLLNDSLKKYFYVLIIIMCILFFSIKYLFVRLEIKKG